MRLNYRMYVYANTIRRAFCRRFYCRFWGHKRLGDYDWSVAYIGKFDKQASKRGTCENCGEWIDAKQA